MVAESWLGPQHRRLSAVPTPAPREHRRGIRPTGLALDGEVEDYPRDGGHGARRQSLARDRGAGLA